MSRLDPQVERVLELLASAPDPGPSVADRRAAYDEAAKRFTGGPSPDLSAVEDVDAGGVGLRVYRPPGARGAVLWMHGGGWVLGGLDSHDAVCRALASASGANVVSVGYRLAPEHPFPGPLEDCERALAWTAEGFAGEPLAVAGDSAGGTLATVLARRARDAGGPPLRFQLLVYPPTDAACATASHQRYGADGAYGLAREDMVAFWDAYAPGGSSRSPDASPLRAADLTGLPPALVVLAECDPLVDEAGDYADRLRAAGVDVEVRVWPGTVHGFLRWRGAVDAAHEALDEAARALRAALTGAPGSAK